MLKKLSYRQKLAVWGLIYFAAVIASLVVAGIGHQEPSRGFWLEFGVGLGFAGLSIMGLQFLLTARFRSIAAPFGLDELLHFHRQAGFIAALFVFGHVIILFLADPAFIEFLHPADNAPRAVSLNLVIILILILIASTVWREQLAITYEWWRAFHGIFALIIVAIGLGHALMVGFYIDMFWKQALWTFLTGSAMVLLIYARAYKPWQLMSYPYEVVDVRSESHDVYTLELAADGHDGLEFEPGQFVWITIGPTPFQLQQHPFTLASSADKKGAYELTIKQLGDFTGDIPTIEPGTRAWLEGPYGTFTPKEPAPPKTVLIGGGIGVTPMMSMLRTAADSNDQRPYILLFGNKDRESIIFYEELEELKLKISLTVIHILEEPPENWQGETGFIDKELLMNRLSDDQQEYHYYICGPEPMMDGVETALRDLTVPVDHIHSERFNIV